MKNFRLLAALLFAALGWTACQATHIQSIKKDPAYQAKSMRNVLVIAVVRKPTTQRMLEDEFVKRFQKREVQATASYTLIREGEKMDEAAWRKHVAESQYDAVVVSRLTSLEVIEKDVDAKMVTSDRGNGYGYYSSGYVAMYQPAFTLREETAAIETRVFQAAGQKQVWSAHSQTDIEQGRDPAVQIRNFVIQMMGKIYG